MCKFSELLPAESIDFWDYKEMLQSMSRKKFTEGTVLIFDWIFYSVAFLSKKPNIFPRLFIVSAL